MTVLKCYFIKINIVAHCLNTVTVTRYYPGVSPQHSYSGDCTLNSAGVKISKMNSSVTNRVIILANTSKSNRFSFYNFTPRLKILCINIYRFIDQR